MQWKGRHSWTLRQGRRKTRREAQEGKASTARKAGGRQGWKQAERRWEKANTACADKTGKRSGNQRQAMKSLSHHPIAR